MKTITKNDKIIVFLNKRELKGVTFNDEEKLEDYFNSIFIKLNRVYDMDLNGYYDIDIYLDDNYGAVLEINNEDLDYYNYFNQIDMKLNISKINYFLYEIKYEFLDSKVLENAICYKKFDKIYLKVDKIIDEYLFMRIIELSNVIYGPEVEDILRYGKKVIV